MEGKKSNDGQSVVLVYRKHNALFLVVIGALRRKEETWSRITRQFEK